MSANLPQAARITGATQRQLRHWIAIGLLDPVFDTAIGPRGEYRFGWNDLLLTHRLVQAVRAGVSVSLLASARREDRLLGFTRRLELVARDLREIVESLDGP